MLTPGDATGLAATPRGRQVLVHEAVHGVQATWFGPFWIPAYFLGSVYAVTSGGEAYRDNPFEKRAHDLEPQVFARIEQCLSR